MAKHFKTCCFIGHRKISVTEEFKNKLISCIENLIVKERVAIFLFGTRSEFNDLCYEIVDTFQNGKFPQIRKVVYLCYGEYAVGSEEKERIQYLYSNVIKIKEKVKGYDEIKYIEKTKLAGKIKYVVRNYELIDDSDIVVMFYKKNYSIEKEDKNSKLIRSSKGGTYLAYEYVKKKKKRLILFG